ncbi:hypothetical protein RAS1_40980 [Phycisphaerae bacterium RAS1]|nr:hypothetical protein RAS1_40980 [Phycisphaerae bacterium RAS1]
MSADVRDFEKELSAYLDGELGDARRREVERALAASPELRRRLEELRDVSVALRELPRAAAPAALRAALATLAERPAAGGGAAPRLVRLSLVLRVFSAAAVVALFALVGTQVYLPDAVLRETKATRDAAAPVERQLAAADKAPWGGPAEPSVAASPAEDAKEEADRATVFATRTAPAAAVAPAAGEKQIAASEGVPPPAVGGELAARADAPEARPAGAAPESDKVYLGGALMSVAPEALTLDVTVRADSPEATTAVRRALEGFAESKSDQAVGMVGGRGGGGAIATQQEYLVSSAIAADWIDRLEEAAPRQVEYTLRGRGSFSQTLKALRSAAESESDAESPGEPSSVGGMDTRWRSEIRETPGGAAGAAGLAAPPPPGVRPAPATVPRDAHPREDRLKKLRRAEGQSEAAARSAGQAREPETKDRADAAASAPRLPEPAPAGGAVPLVAESAPTDRDIDGTATAARDTADRKGSPMFFARLRGIESRARSAMHAGLPGSLGESPSGGAVRLRILVVPPLPAAESQASTQPR